MKLKIEKPLSIEHVGFHFRHGVAEVRPEDEAKARRISRQLGYEIIEDIQKPKEKAPAKAKAPKAKAKVEPKAKTE